MRPSKHDDVRSSDYFLSPDRVYLASADNYKGLEGLVESMSLLPCKHFYSVIGGMGGLNILCRLPEVQTITLFDINPYMINICNLMLKIISAAHSREEFISLIYCKPFKQRWFPPDKIAEFYKQPVSKKLVHNLQSILSSRELETYKYFYQPYTLSSQQEFVMGPCSHCTSLRVYHDLLISDPMSYPDLSREHIKTHKIQSINSFFFGKGWLRTEKRFNRVKQHIARTEVAIKRQSIYELLPPIESGLYASNVLEGTGKDFSELTKRFDWLVWYSRRTNYIISEYVCNSEHLIPCQKIFSKGNRNPHEDCCLLLENTLAIQTKVFLEVIQPNGIDGMNSGFYYYPGQNRIHVKNYLQHDYDARQTSLMIIHILLGNGCSFSIWKDVIKNAYSSGQSICILEHNPTANEWPELEVHHWNIPPIIMIDRYLLSLDKNWIKYGTLSLSGKGVRNYCWILEK